MLQDPGKRDALMCSLQQALCPNPHPEKENARIYHIAFHMVFTLVCPVLPWSRLASPSVLTIGSTPFQTSLPLLSTAQKSTGLGVRPEY